MEEEGAMDQPCVVLWPSHQACHISWGVGMLREINGQELIFLPPLGMLPFRTNLRGSETTPHHKPCGSAQWRGPQRDNVQVTPATALGVSVKKTSCYRCMDVWGHCSQSLGGKRRHLLAHQMSSVGDSTFC